jgi:hypothetical protein
MDLLLDIIFTGLLVFGIICFFAGLGEKKRNNRQAASYPVTLHGTCPHCGKTAMRTYTPGRDPYPHLFTCGECYRKFGDVSRMSPEEKRQYDESEADCRRARNCPQLATIMSIVDDRLHNRYERSKSYFVVIKDGEVYEYNFKSGSMKKEVLCHYTGPVSRIGDQHLCTMCIRQMEKRHPHLAGRYTLMDNGISVNYGD